jgi:NAD+ synthase
MQVDKIIDHIVGWLSEYACNAGLRGFVVGISGGIDSAVTSTLCARTGLEVLALNMPIYQAPDQRSLAERHRQWLETHYPLASGLTVDLTQAFQALEAVLPEDIQDGLSMANTRSRLRMLTLYAFANNRCMLVAGTGNKVEDFGVGFFTKYGDGAVDIAPIADLMKSEVYALGKELNILEEIQAAQPTDGLWTDNRSDEEQLGASYDELEWAMRFEAEAGDETRLSDRQCQVLSRYRQLNRCNRHKMVPIPVAEIPDRYRSP